MEDVVKRKTIFHVEEPEKDAALLSGEAAVTCVSFARWQQVMLLLLKMWA